MKHLKTFENFLNEAINYQDIAKELVEIAAYYTDADLSSEMTNATKCDDADKVTEFFSNLKEMMKDEEPGKIKEFEMEAGRFLAKNKINEQEEILNEDSSTAFLLLMQAAIVNGLLIGQMASSGDGGNFTPIADLKRWWNNRKSDKAVKSIIDKIKDDKDVIEFMKLTPSQQRGKFRSLIATKLSGDELEYLNKINRSHFKNESVDEGDSNLENYMFFGNLKTIKDRVEEILLMDPSVVDGILKDGHNWAVDHVTTSKDDVEEVSNFLKNEVKETGTGVISVK